MKAQKQPTPATTATIAVNGFWSLTLYNEHHFFAPNEINRYSVGTKNKDLKTNADRSLTTYVQADPPAERTTGCPRQKAPTSHFTCARTGPSPPSLTVRGRRHRWKSRNRQRQYRTGNQERSWLHKQEHRQRQEQSRSRLKTSRKEILDGAWKFPNAEAIG